MAEEEFYRDRYFQQLSVQIADLNANFSTMQKDITEIKQKIVYMYGFAAAIGLVASFFIDWVRTNFMGSH